MIEYATRLAKSIARSVRTWGLKDPALVEMFGGHGTASGVSVTEESAMTFGAVFACVRVIAETLGSLPLVTYRRTGNGKERANEHPLYRLLHDAPNSKMTAMAFREALTGHVLTWGNGYAEIERTVSGVPVAMHLLRPDRVRPFLDGDMLRYEVTSSVGPSAFLVAGDMLHVAGLGGDGIVGYSPIRLAQETIGLAMASERFGSSFFGNNARPGGILTHPGQLKEEAAKRLKRSWESMHRGSENAHKVAVLEEGVTWQSVGVPPGEAQLLEQRHFSIEEVARWYRVPPHKIGHLLRATFSNIEQQSIEFTTDTLRPWLVRWEQEIQRKLFAGSAEFFAEHLVDGLLRGDTASRTASLQTQFLHGALSIDEWRAIENRNPLPDGAGARYFVPLNMTPVDHVARDPVPVDALLQVAEKVAGGLVPKESAVAILTEAFPRLEADAINKIVGSIEVVKVETQAAAPDTEKVSRSIEAILADAMNRMIYKEAEAAKRAANKPANFLTWIDEFYGRHETQMAEAILPAIRAACSLRGIDGEEHGWTVAIDRARRHCEESRAALLEMTGRATVETLATETAALVGQWADRAKKNLAPETATK